MTNKNKVGKLENTIVRKGYSKVLRIRTLKDLIQYYDDETGEFKRDGSDEIPEVEFCLEPAVRQLMNMYNADDDDDDFEYYEPEPNKERNSC